MEPYTLDRNFQKKDILDGFSSLIWTERYYGNSEVELNVPATSEMRKKIPEGIFLGIDGSDEVMVLESTEDEEGNLKFTGMSLLPWMNHRFVRASANHKDKVWSFGGGSPGWTVWNILYSMCCAGSEYLNGTINTGISNPQQLIIPGLKLKDFDKSGDNINVDINYGPVYDAMLEIAITYEIGMQITLEPPPDIFQIGLPPLPYSLEFRSYKGLDRTSGQTVNPPVRFSPQFDSLTDIKELRSIAALKTLVYSFAEGLEPQDPEDPVITTVPGMANRSEGGSITGFDLRALMTIEPLTIEMVGGSSEDEIPGDPAKVVELLNNRASIALKASSFINTVDGEIVPTNQFKYGVHYNLGDLIEVQGNSEIIQVCRVTEYIRSQDEAGEKAYPTVTMIDYGGS